MKQVRLKRVYEDYQLSDGYRVLVDRLWPRGIKKENAHIDLWLKDIAPSSDLRKWFNHEPDKWPEFKQKYLKEIAASHDAAQHLKSIIEAHKAVTLLYGAKDERHNQAVVLQKWLLS
ncbi:MAG TPA: DUF488 domain-containing protein [Edaphocola sp.]|nr:DUF488 domain-containing protein [Edaphocola sp.]